MARDRDLALIVFGALLALGLASRFRPPRRPAEVPLAARTEAAPAAVSAVPAAPSIEREPAEPVIEEPARPAERSVSTTVVSERVAEEMRAFYEEALRTAEPERRPMVAEPEPGERVYIPPSWKPPMPEELYEEIVLRTPEELPETALPRRPEMPEPRRPPEPPEVSPPTPPTPPPTWKPPMPEELYEEIVLRTPEERAETVEEARAAEEVEEIAERVEREMRELYTRYWRSPLWV